MNEREVLTVCHVCSYSMVPPHSFWSLVKLSMYVVYYVVRFHFGPKQYVKLYNMYVVRYHFIHFGPDERRLHTKREHK